MNDEEYESVEPHHAGMFKRSRELKSPFADPRYGAYENKNPFEPLKFPCLTLGQIDAWA